MMSPCRHEAAIDSTAPASADEALLLECKDVGVTFANGGDPVTAVEGVSLRIQAGRVLGIVGESGSGKSQLLLGLTALDAQARVSGEVRYRGTTLSTASGNAREQLKGGQIAYVFQDPMTCLNPFLRISTQLVEVAMTHRSMSRGEALSLAQHTLERVRIPDAAKRLRAWPHELSGGMRQRVMIAMALMGSPRLLLADEPTTALDATVQIQVLDLLRELCDEDGVGLVLITHDIGVIARIADDVAVMYASRIVERGCVAAVLANPSHPYTRRLIDSTVGLEHPLDEALVGIRGQLPGRDAPRDRCLFAPRCDHATPLCRAQQPHLATSSTQRAVACHFPLGSVR